MNNDLQAKQVTHKTYQFYLSFVFLGSSNGGNTHWQGL